MAKLYIPKEEETALPDNRNAAAVAHIYFRLVNALGYDLIGEWMEEYPDGKYLHRRDVLAVISEYLQQESEERLGIDQIRRLAQSRVARESPQEALAAIRRLAAEILGGHPDDFSPADIKKGHQQK